LASVLLTRRIPSSVLSRLEQAHDVDVHYGDAGLPRDELLRRVGDKAALITVFTDRIDAELLDAGSRLRVVANVGVGYDHIDVAAAKARGIVVTNTPDVLTEATAELTWALILGIARRVAEGDRLIRAGRWKGWAPDFMIGTELRGKQLGIVGAGRIGRAVAAKAPAFGMTVTFAARGKGPRERGTMSFDELLVTSDVVSIHAPLTPETRHLIDRKALVRMKRSALLVNTSRGPLVDEDALAWALGERLIAGAALDVFEREPDVHLALLTMDNVLLVPHVGSATRETRTAMADLAVSNVLAVLAGKSPLTPV
jgi:glyoxylate reductase